MRVRIFINDRPVESVPQDVLDRFAEDTAKRIGTAMRRNASDMQRRAMARHSTVCDGIE